MSLLKKTQQEIEWLVLDVGGSIIAPAHCEGPDLPFVSAFLNFLYKWLLQSPVRYVALVVGGGITARQYQKEAAGFLSHDALDWLGIRATHLNGEYVRLLAAERTAKEAFVKQPLLMEYDKLPPIMEFGRIVVGGGWKPGFSTDYDSVLLAEYVGAKRLLCLSNIGQIYDDDPSKNPGAKPLTSLDWATYQKITSKEWSPGLSVPFDPVATDYASKLGLELVFADGRNLDNLELILNRKDFIGTTVR